MKFAILKLITRITHMFGRTEMLAMLVVIMAIATVTYIAVKNYKIGLRGLDKSKSSSTK